MKGKSKILGIIALVMAMVGTLVTTASATTLGDGIAIGGYNVGWILVAIGIFVIVLTLLKLLEGKKFMTGAIVLILIGAILLVPYETQTIVTTDDDDDCCDFEYTCAVVNGADATSKDIQGVWDEDSKTWTLPITVTDSQDGNLSNNFAALNITFDPIGSGKTSDDICTIHFETDYLMKYGGEYLLDEDSTNYIAIWNSALGSTNYIDDSIDITAGSTAWARLNYTFNNGTAGNWVTELDAIGDSKTWYITMTNDCGTWTDTITVKLIVVAYTDTSTSD